MKKIFLLIALPALMVLVGCSNAAVKQSAKINNENVMLEDNLAHEELFGGSQLAPKKIGIPDIDPGSDPGWTKAPKIGVQFKSYNRDAVDYYAVRYVAAIADTADMTVTWSRGVSEKDSNKIRNMSGGYESSVRYDSLNNNSTSVNATGEGSGYQKYVVYTMYDIPQAQADSFIVAYLTLSKAGETSVSSKAVAARIAGGHAFSFAANKSSGYFMAGRIGGNDNVVLDLDAGSGTNKAEKADQSLVANDLFGYFLIANENEGYLSSFQYYGWDTFKDEQYYLERDAGSNLFKVRVSGTYDIYVNKDFKMWVNCDSTVNMNLYFKPDETWLGGDSKSAVWFNSAFHGLTLIDDVNKIYCLEGYNFKSYPTFNFTKHNPAVDGYSWYDDGGNCWDQTINITFTDNGNPTNNLYTITGGDYKARSGTWSHYSPSI